MAQFGFAGFSLLEKSFETFGDGLGWMTQVVDDFVDEYFVVLYLLGNFGLRFGPVRGHSIVNRDVHGEFCLRKFAYRQSIVWFA